MAGKIKIDPKQVEALASRGLTREQVAHNLGVGVRTLQRRANEDPAFEEAYLRGKAKGITEIANALFKKAQEGNTTAQIFFLKCNGWKEESSVELKVNEPTKGLKEMTDEELKAEIAKYGNKGRN